MNYFSSAKLVFSIICDVFDNIYLLYQLSIHRLAQLAALALLQTTWISSKIWHDDTNVDRYLK